MAVLVIVVTTSDTITDLNAKIHNPGNPHQAVKNVENYVYRALAGAVDCDFQVTSRDTAPTVTTSGSGSQQETYDLT